MVGLELGCLRIAREFRVAARGGDGGIKRFFAGFVTCDKITHLG